MRLSTFSALRRDLEQYLLRTSQIECTYVDIRSFPYLIVQINTEYCVKVRCNNDIYKKNLKHSAKWS
jgi:hypothetical protein